MMNYSQNFRKQSKFLLVLLLQTTFSTFKRRNDKTASPCRRQGRQKRSQRHTKKQQHSTSCRQQTRKLKVFKRFYKPPRSDRAATRRVLLPIGQCQKELYATTRWRTMATGLTTRSAITISARTRMESKSKSTTSRF